MDENENLVGLLAVVGLWDNINWYSREEEQGGAKIGIGI